MVILWFSGIACVRRRRKWCTTSCFIGRRHRIYGVYNSLFAVELGDAGCEYPVAWLLSFCMPWQKHQDISENWPLLLTCCIWRARNRTTLEDEQIVIANSKLLSRFRVGVSISSWIVLLSFRPHTGNHTSIFVPQGITIWAQKDKGLYFPRIFYPNDTNPNRSATCTIPKRCVCLDIAWLVKFNASVLVATLHIY